MDLKPGQVLMGRQQLAKTLKMSEKNIRTAIKLLKAASIVASETASSISIITIVKWSDYQGNTHEVASEVASKAASSGPADGQQTATEQEDKNVENDKNKHLSEVSSELIDELYNLYPSKRSNGTSTGKSHKDKDKIKRILADGGYDLRSGIEFHIHDCKGWPKNLSTFLNNLPDLKAFETAKRNTIENDPARRRWLNEQKRLAGMEVEE